MRRNLLTVLGIMMLALAVPSVALAHRDRGHHHHHKAKTHHAKFRIVHIGSPAAVPVAPPATTSPATPPAPETAGTVTSYANGVLTLTLKDGSTVSGKVTNATRIRCVKATPPSGAGVPPSDDGPGDDNGQGDDQMRGDMSQHGDHGSGEWSHGGDGNGDDDGEAPGSTEPPCDSSALVPGAVVLAAELRIGPGGTEFESVWLMR
jgi:hypothetical protein